MYNIYNDNIDYIDNNVMDIEIDQPSIEIDDNPYSYFKLFFTDILVSYIIDKSDIYQIRILEKMQEAKKLKNHSRITSWKKPSFDKFNKYLGIVLCMSIHSNSDYSSNFFIL